MKILALMHNSRVWFSVVATETSISVETIGIQSLICYFYSHFVILEGTTWNPIYINCYYILGGTVIRRLTLARWIDIADWLVIIDNFNDE